MSELKLVDIRNYPDISPKSGTNGVLSVVEQSEFPFKRVFWITDLYGSNHRAGHAHKRLEQFLVCLEGYCRINVLKQNGDGETFQLKSDNKGLWVPPLHWLDIGDFRRGTILLVLASEPYDVNDYINNRNEFLVTNGSGI